jgi:hypothetical protein
MTLAKIASWLKSGSRAMVTFGNDEFQYDRRVLGLLCKMCLSPDFYVRQTESHGRA